jgi:hypothetical protein
MSDECQSRHIALDGVLRQAIKKSSTRSSSQKSNFWFGFALITLHQTHCATARERNQRQSVRKIRIIATSKATAATPRKIRMRFWFISTYTPRLA